MIRDLPGRCLPLLLAAGLGLAGLQGHGARAESEAGPWATGSVRTVEAVDLNRYAGFWYEIARIPNRFQARCARRSIASYRLRRDGQIAVLNQCIKRNGNVEQASGIARVVDRRTQARLKVSLVSLLGWRPFWGDYWILGLADDYGWAVVASPDRRYGWILSRTPTLAPASLASIDAILERNGFRRSSFRLSDPG